MSRQLAVVGPTATGKTALAVLLAERLGNAELVNADSRQVAVGLRVGTCAPTPAELRGVPCHLLDLVEPGADFTVADWLGQARPCLAELGIRGIRPILVGGTGLYVRALLDRWALPATSPNAAGRAARERQLELPGGLNDLVADLLARDPGAARVVDLPNPRRVLRALELLDAGGGGVNQLRRRAEAAPSLRVALRLPPGVHSRLIQGRAERMLGSGALLEECRQALARGISAEALGRAGIGYREGLGVLTGSLTQAAALESIIARTRRYAKAQRTWFRGDPQTTWVDWDGGDIAAPLARVLALVKEGVTA